MKIRFIIKIGILFGAFLLVGISLLHSNMYAASIGQRLAEPEAGWQRYDETAPFLYYTGQWTKAEAAVVGDHYKNTYSYTTDIKNGKLHFTFYGTKLRYIG